MIRSRTYWASRRAGGADAWRRRTREAASRVRLRHASAPPALREAQKNLERITKEKDAAINNQEYEEAATLRESEATARESVDSQRAEWQSQVSGEQPKVDEE
ncbi:MAG: ATP-dependent Clp protease ATP-binding subunit ClpC, partial [Chloroflexota bacterium]|nr:ATP-dependent Clp protease ATP-binding subunit ClpC [Chloroflexota bacterium]